MSQCLIESITLFWNLSKSIVCMGWWCQASSPKRSLTASCSSSQALLGTHLEKHSKARWMHADAWCLRPNLITSCLWPLGSFGNVLPELVLWSQAIKVLIKEGTQKTWTLGVWGNWLQKRHDWDTSLCLLLLISL